MKLRTGKAGVNVLDRSVFKRLGSIYMKSPQDFDPKNPDPGDSDVWNLVTETLSRGSGDDGFLCVMNAAGGLAAAGAVPAKAQTSVLLPVNAREEELRKIEDGIAEAAAKLGIKVTGGHTEVSSSVNKAVITTAVMGKATVKRAAPAAGQEIVMTKWTALQGTYLLASLKEAELMHRFPVSLLETCQMMRSLVNTVPEGIALQKNKGISYVTDLSQGGVYAGLWKTALDTGMGLEVSLPDIPIRQETIEICNYYDINPYEMDSAGSLIAVCDDGKALTAELAEAGIHASVIGRLISGHDKRIINQDECSNLNLPQTDPLTAVLG